ncbi:hypothetical protein INT43_006885 [Umbelopsis isabellina]|uniref:Protein YOP1 n=1 Tax=Mortierella isabellina TaxID=91625 RepID=A0A8H7PXY4_MORIS|nr:hypothetical protein INT43_006885 [Umbelopsis isabellina]
MLPTFLYFILKTVLLQLYPAYISYKAIKSSTNLQQLAPLLMYWIVTATFLVAEYVCDILLFWFPFYNDIKALLVIWFILPQTQGSVIIYQQVIQPFLTQHESRIDRALLDVQKQARRTGLEYGKRGVAILNNLLGELVNKLRAMILGQEAPPATSAATAQPQASGLAAKLPSWDMTSITPFAIFSSLIRDPNSQTKDEPFFIHPSSLGMPPKDQTELRSQRDHLEKMMKDLDALEPTLLERTESFDSIASYSSAKKVDTPGDSSAAGWASYLGGWWPARPVATSDSQSTDDVTKSKDDVTKSKAD